MLKLLCLTKVQMQMKICRGGVLIGTVSGLAFKAVGDALSTVILNCIVVLLVLRGPFINMWVSVDTHMFMNGPRNTNRSDREATAHAHATCMLYGSNGAAMDSHCTRIGHGFALHANP